MNQSQKQAQEEILQKSMLFKQKCKEDESLSSARKMLKIILIIWGILRAGISLYGLIFSMLYNETTIIAYITFVVSSLIFLFYAIAIYGGFTGLVLLPLAGNLVSISRLINILPNFSSFTTAYQIYLSFYILVLLINFIIIGFILLNPKIKYYATTYKNFMGNQPPA